MLQNEQKSLPVRDVLPNIVINVDSQQDSSISEHREDEIQEEIFAAMNMSILCVKCSNYIKVTNLEDHRTLHDALALFKYDFHTKPMSEQALSRKRTALLKDLNKTVNISRSGYRKELGKIDLAYEIIKSGIYDRSNKAKPSFIEHHDVIIRSVRAKLQQDITLGICVSTNEKWKSEMEDAYSYKCDASEGQTVTYFGVFDGYSGPTAAKQCADQFYQILKETVKFSACFGGTDECNLADGLQQAYDNMDKVLLYGANETSRNRWSGCSATTCLLGNETLHVANVGNVKAVLVKDDGSFHVLTEDHTPANKREKRRIKANGDVRKWSKTVWVNGVVMTTRGLGNHGDPILKSSILNVPSICCIPLADGQIILVASYGFWQVFNESEAVLLIREWLEKNAVEASDNTNFDISNDNVVNASVEIIVKTEDYTKTDLQDAVNKIEDNKMFGDDVNTKSDINYESSEIVNENQCLQCLSAEESGCNCVSNSQEKTGRSDNFSVVNSSKATEQERVKEVSLLKLLRTLVMRSDATLVAVGISKHLMKAALTGGAKENITVLVVLPHDMHG